MSGLKWNENGDAYEPPVRFMRIVTSPSTPRPFSTTENGYRRKTLEGRLDHKKTKQYL